MSRNDIGRSMHPSASMQIESKLVARRVSFTFEPNLGIDQIRDVEGNQVRLSEHRSPKAMVDRYAEQMKGGAIFPAIVVNDRHELVDGNTRWMAAQRNNKETIPAYVCADLSALQARSLSVELNQSHGLSMTEDEIHAFVTSAVEEGQVLDTKAYSRMTGVKASALGRWVAAKHFEMRAARDGVKADRFEGLSDSVRAALHVTKLRAVFLKVTALAIEAGVPAAQLKAIIAEANVLHPRQRRSQWLRVPTRCGPTKSRRSQRDSRAPGARVPGQRCTSADCCGSRLQTYWTSHRTSRATCSCG
jgi:hypothetical protein